MAAALAFDLQHVFYHYSPNEPALRDISLQIRQGEQIVLLGPNGSGKSTLQKILAGLVFPDNNPIIAFGQEITAKNMRDNNFAAEYRRKVGFVFQNSDVQLFCASVLDEIMFGPLALGLSFEGAKQKAVEMMEFIGIGSLAERLPHHLSGGEKKKVALAAVLINNPAVLILDEPTNGLDPKSQRWMISTLEQLHRSGKTIITATHHLDIVSELAERVIVIGESRGILADASPKAIVADRDMLLKANLIDERYHVHVHGEDGHTHVHAKQL